MINNLITLSNELSLRGFHKESSRVDILIKKARPPGYDPTAYEAHFDGSAPSKEVDWCEINDNIILDALGAIPLYGDGLDVVRTAGFVKCNKYFDAILTILASAPVIGAAMVAVKMAKKIKTVGGLYSNVIVPIAKQIKKTTSEVLDIIIKYVLKYNYRKRTLFIPFSLKLKKKRGGQGGRIKSR